MPEIKTLTIDGVRYDVVDDGAVRKVTGKGLSTNDYTDTDKAKLDGIDTTQLVTKAVDDLVNYYLKSETYTKAEVQQLIAAIQGVSFVSVATLPTASAETMGGKIYLVPSANPKTQNVKDEYITVEAEGSYSWEQIGSTEADLTGYVTDAELTAALADYATTATLTTLFAAKQDVISDLATIRSGAAAGATAYQKPQTGIPASDLASGVIPDVSGKYEKPSTGIPKTDLAQGVQDSLGLADSAYQKPQTGIPASDIASGVIPDVSGKENSSNKVTSLSAQSTDTQYPSAKATYDAINPSVQSSQPAGGFAPGVVYDLGTLTGSVTFDLAAGVTGKVNAYHWTFDTGSTAPTITWPSGIIWPDGFTPSVDASMHYEVLVRNGYASMLTFSLT